VVRWSTGQPSRRRSGLSFADNLTLALEITDVQTSVDNIVAGLGHEHQTWPTAQEERTDHPVTFTPDEDAAAFALPSSDEKRTIGFTVNGGRTEDVLLFADEYYVADMVIAVRGPGQDWTETVIADNLGRRPLRPRRCPPLHGIRIRGPRDRSRLPRSLAGAYQFEVVPT
jgi:hypothetical protein